MIRKPNDCGRRDVAEAEEGALAYVTLSADTIDWAEGVAIRRHHSLSRWLLLL
jgi:hypothetical protein